MRTALIVVLAASFAVPGVAQPAAAADPSYPEATIAARIAAMPLGVPRATGPGLEYSLKLALAALDACKAKGGSVSVLITDSAGVPIVLLSGDGAGERSQLIAQSKANTVVRYRTTSTDVKRKAATDPALASEISRNPDIGVPRRGAVPLMDKGAIIGVLSVAGLAGEADGCAEEAIAKVRLR